MNSGLDAVLAALDAVASPVDFFLRDDDAGWNDARLIALLGVVASAGVAIDLAAIPLAVDDALCAERDGSVHGAGRPRREEDGSRTGPGSKH